MDTARDVRSRELVEGVDLWNMDAVERDVYTCPGCATQVFPASFDREHNKKRPYFTLGPNNKHELGCDVDGEEKVVKRARKERVGTEQGFPLPFPNRLSLSDERPVVAGGPNSPASPGDGKASSNAQKDGAARRRHHGHTVKTIRPACRTYIQFPNDRDTLPLEIPGVAGKTYAKIFSWLGSKKPAHYRSPTRLYYAAIRWTALPIVENDRCELTLQAGEWDQEKGRFKNLSRVRVDWSGWSQSRRDMLMREFTTTREEAKEKAKANKQVKGWIFFVGTQDKADPGLFHVDNHRLLCCQEAEMLWPTKS